VWADPSLRAQQSNPSRSKEERGLFRCARNDDLLNMHIIPATRFARGLAVSSRPLRKEGAGKAGCALHPRSRVQNLQKSAHEHTGSAEAVRPSLRNGFTAYVALSAVIGLSCHRRLRKSLPANLTPASRRQDHTILPSASQAPSSEAPPAAIASSPASVTIAIRPSSGVDGGVYKVICDFGKPEYFSGRDWTGKISLIGLRKLDFRRKSLDAAGGIPSESSS